MPPPNYDGPPVPVLVSFTAAPAAAPGNRRRSNAGGEPPEILRNASVLNLLNSSDKTLELTVIDVNMSTLKTTQTSVFLPPRGSQNLGQSMESGDEITLRSPEFQDLTQTVP